MCRIDIRKYLATGVPVGGQLNENRGEKVTDTLFFLVSKVKEEICQGSVAGITQRHDVFYDRRASVYEFSYLGVILRNDKPKNALS